MVERKNQSKEVEKSEDEGSQKTQNYDVTRIQGTACEGILESLERSFIAEVCEPIGVEEAVRRIEKAGVSCQNINAIGIYKFLVTLTSREEPDLALKPGSMSLVQQFNKLVAWSPK